MNDNRTQKIAGLAAGAILLPIVLGILFGAAAVYYLTVVVVLLAGVLGYSLLVPPPRRKIDPWEKDDQPPRPPEPEKPRRPSPKDVELGSELPSSGTAYRFRVTGTVSWRPVRDSADHGDPDALAREAVLTRAAEITKRYSLIERERAELELAAELGASQRAGKEDIEAWARDLKLTVDDEDHRRVRIVEEVQKDSEVFDYQRSHEVDVRKYLSDDAFATQGSTLVWWLSRNLRRFDDSVDRLDTFARVSAIAQGHTDPSPQARRTATAGPRIADQDGGRPGGRPSGLLRGLLPSVDDDERGMLAEHFARVAEEQGYPGVARSLRSEHGLHDVRESTEGTGASGEIREEEPDDSPDESSGGASDGPDDDTPGPTQEGDRPDPS